jgi:hypothetical protein
MRLRKEGLISGAPSNNGMHPTADTPLVIHFQRLGAAGDAGRYVANNGGTRW